MHVGLFVGKAVAVPVTLKLGSAADKQQQKSEQKRRQMDALHLSTQTFRSRSRRPRSSRR